MTKMAFGKSFTRLRFGLLAPVVLLSFGCQPVQITGRSQLSLMSDAQVSSIAEKSFSRFYSAADREGRVLKATESAQAAQTIAQVKQVSDRVLAASGLSNKLAWETIVVKAKEPNAFVLPNGKIFVFTGILPVAKNPAGLAAVIGHEIGHVVARHGAERLSQALLANVAKGAAAVALAASDNKNAPAINAALGLGLQYGLLLPYSRTHESEADHLGLLYMAKAGYDPAEAVDLWSRMEAASSSKKTEFLSTHPAPSTRRAQLAQWMPEARVLYANPNRPLPKDLFEIRQASAQMDAQGESAPIADKPKLELGYWYAYSTGGKPAVKNEVTAEKACPPTECLLFSASDGGSDLLTAELGLREQRKSDGTWLRYSPAVPLYRWPLKVGSSWTETISVDRSNGKSGHIQFKADVLSFEEVSTKSGTYDAFKIAMAINGSRAADIWYAPEVGFQVRHVTYGIWSCPELRSNR